MCNTLARIDTLMGDEFTRHQNLMKKLKINSISVKKVKDEFKNQRDKLEDDSKSNLKTKKERERDFKNIIKLDTRVFIQ